MNIKATVNSLDRSLHLITDKSGSFDSGCKWQHTQEKTQWPEHVTENVKRTIQL